MPHHFSVNDLPRRLTLIQAVAWIAARDPVVVLRASLEDRECARAIAHLGDDDEWCGTAKGISLHAIDLRCGVVGAGDAAADELIRALRDGKIIAVGSYFSQENGWGKACPIPAAEWDSIILGTTAGADRQLVPCHRRDDGGLVAAPVKNWRVIGIEAGDMVRIWPAPQPPIQEENFAALAGIEAKSDWPDLPISEDGKHVVLPDEIYIPAKTTYVWLAKRRDANWIMDLGTALKAVGELTPKLKSGELSAFLFDAGDAAKDPQKVRADLFSRGMALHHSGWLTKAGNVSMDEYAALGRVPIGPVWFLRAELLSLWPTSPLPVQAAPPEPPDRLPRGPRPIKRTRIANEMMADFQGRPNVLSTDTLDNLALAYNAARETVKLARADALAELSRNSGETLNTNK